MFVIFSVVVIIFKVVAHKNISHISFFIILDSKLHPNIHQTVQ